MKKRKWNGTWPTRCDMCNTELEKYATFADAYIQDIGMWGLLCERCCKKYEVRFGTGFGQQYSTKTLEKIAG